jgi:hypothetical protein
VTNQLKSVSLIEPEFFRKREPVLYERGHVWYTVFVCTRQPDRRKGIKGAPRGTFRQLIEKVAEPIRPVHGVCFMDYCSKRVADRLPEMANALLVLGDPAAVHEQVDAQTYWGYYPGGRPQ